jgi:hypothetical protein
MVLFLIQKCKKKPSVLACPRCTLVNGFDNKYCSKCSYPLILSAFDEIKEAERKKILDIEQKYERIMSMIQQNPLLALAALSNSDITN